MDVFEALADPRRRQGVQMLSVSPRRAGELANAAGMSAPAMSRHLKTLLDAGLIEDERPRDDARLRGFRLRANPFRALQAFLDQLQADWNVQLRSFKRHVEARKS